jgi:hypothetical protein
MVIATSAPVLPNQEKTVQQNRPIHWRTLYKPWKHIAIWIELANLKLGL